MNECPEEDGKDLLLMKQESEQFQRTIEEAEKSMM